MGIRASTYKFGVWAQFRRTRFKSISWLCDHGKLLSLSELSFPYLKTGLLVFVRIKELGMAHGGCWGNTASPLSREVGTFRLLDAQGHLLVDPSAVGGVKCSCLPPRRKTCGIGTLRIFFWPPCWGQGTGNRSGFRCLIASIQRGSLKHGHLTPLDIWMEWEVEIRHRLGWTF